MDLISTAKDNWEIIQQAPLAFILMSVAVGSVCFRFGLSRRAQIIANLESRLALEDDRINEYERKLQTSSPDEAVAAQERQTQMINDQSLEIERLRRIADELGEQHKSLVIQGVTLSTRTKQLENGVAAMTRANRPMRLR